MYRITVHEADSHGQAKGERPPSEYAVIKKDKTAKARRRFARSSIKFYGESQFN